MAFLQDLAASSPVGGEVLWPADNEACQDIGNAPSAAPGSSTGLVQRRARATGRSQGSKESADEEPAHECVERACVDCARFEPSSQGTSGEDELRGLLHGAEDRERVHEDSQVCIA